MTNIPHTWSDEINFRVMVVVLLITIITVIKMRNSDEKQ